MTTMMLVTAAVALAVIAFAHMAPSAPVPSTAHATESNRSNEHATRLLAGRYARGEITVDEYRRMLLVLKP